MIDPIALATTTAAATVLGSEFLKGVAGEAGKNTWLQIKDLFGWQLDPPVSDLPEKIATCLATSPELVYELLLLLKQAPANVASTMVGRLDVSGGKVTVVETMHAENISF